MTNYHPAIPVLIDPIHLDMIEISPSLTSHIDDSITIYSWMYYRLTPSRYAKTRLWVSNAQQDYQSNQLSSSQWEAIRTRFNAIHDAAIQWFGEAVLLDEFKKLSSLQNNL